MMSYNDYEYARMLVGCTPFIVAPRRDKTENIPKIKNVIFNKPATIVFWEDGTKTVVKAIDEPFDEEKGLAMAIAKKALGNTGSYYDVIKKWLPNIGKPVSKTVIDPNDIIIVCWNEHRAGYLFGYFLKSVREKITSYESTNKECYVGDIHVRFVGEEAYERKCSRGFRGRVYYDHHVEKWLNDFNRTRTENDQGKILIF